MKIAKPIKKTKITKKLIKEYGLCEHHKLSYKKIDSEFTKLFVAHVRLSRDNESKGRILEKIFKENANRNKLYINKLRALRKNFQKKIDEVEEQKLAIRSIWQTKIESYEVANKDLFEKNILCMDKNAELITKNRDITVINHEVTRAYNGLHMMGKFAEDQGIDIKKHTQNLPENNMEFEQDHKVLENGKTVHSYKFKIPPKEKQETKTKKKGKIKND